MTCHTPPTAHALFIEANFHFPGRSRAGDGTCPSEFHHEANPTSDHEPDPRLGNNSCAVDLTHDPAHGCDAHGVIAQQLVDRRDRRVKYLIRHRFDLGHDEICGPSVIPWRNWKWRDANQNQHASHLHISLKHTSGTLNDTSPWLIFYPLPQKEDDMPKPVMVHPKKKQKDGTLPTVLTEYGSHQGTKLTREEAEIQDKAGVPSIALVDELWKLMVVR